MLPIQLRAVTDCKITVTNAAVSLYTLMDTASSATGAQKYYDDKYANGIFIHAEDVSIRYLENGTPTATQGILVAVGNKEYLPGVTLCNLKLISTAGNAAVTVVPMRAERGESPALVKAS